LGRARPHVRLRDPTGPEAARVHERQESTPPCPAAFVGIVRSRLRPRSSHCSPGGLPDDPPGVSNPRRRGIRHLRRQRRRPSLPPASAPAPAPAAVPAPPFRNTIRWTTASEVDSFGFDVFRGESESGPFERLNAKPIAGAGTSDESHSYAFVDDTIDPAKEYFYYVESISIDGVREKFTPVNRAKAKIPPAPAPAP
jgi:hypothetical protein